MMRYDYTAYKRDINLTQYAAHAGYEIDRKKTTRSSIVMRSNADKVIISKKGAIWVYFSVTDDQDQGTIINFVQNRTSKTIGEIGHELQEWIGGAMNLPEPQDYAAEVQEHIYDPKRLDRIFHYCKPVSSHGYLESRGISPKMIGSERFKNRIFTDRYKNAVFPHFKKGQICGLEMKNFDKGVFPRGSEKTFWRSNLKQGDTELRLGEAAIDVLSYAELFPSTKAVYGATSGGMSPEQCLLLMAFIEQFCSLEHIAVLADNDKGGDVLWGKICEIIKKTSFSGELVRHSPETRGQDWNNILNLVQH